MLPWVDVPVILGGPPPGAGATTRLRSPVAQARAATGSLGHMPHTPVTPPAVHRERLHVPLAWWLLALGFALTLVIAVTAYTNLWLGAGVALVSLAVIGGMLGTWGHVPVVADETGLLAGRARVEWPWVASVEPLDAKGVRAAMGPGAQATAYVLLRAYTGGAVKVVLDDPADPHPYWLVSTRHPRTVAAIAARHLGRGTGER